MKHQKIANNHIQQKTLIVFALVLAVILAVCALFYYRTTQFIEASRWVEHTNQVLHKTEEAISALKDAETGQRGYIITGDEKFLEPYKQSIDAIDKHFQEVRRLTADNTAQQQRLDAVEPLLKERLRILADGVELRRGSNFSAAQKLVALGQGNADMEAVRRIIGDVKAEEERLLKIRAEKSAESEHSTLQTLAIIGFLMILFLFVAYWQVRGDISERKRAEILLERERDFVSKVIDNSRALALVLDREGRIVRFNRTCEQTSGYLFEDVRDKTFWEVLLPPAQKETIAAIFKKLRAADYPTAHENLWLTRKGEERLISWSNSALLDPNGEIEFIIGTGIDITESRQAQAALQESESRYRLLFDSNPHPTWVYELDTLQILAVNDVAESVYGYSKAEFLKMTLRDLRSPEDMPGFLAKINQAAAGIDKVHSSRHQKKDGSFIEVEVDAHSLIYEGKQARLVVATDVSERKRVSEALQQNISLLGSTLEATDNAIVAVRLDGRIVAYNQKYLRMWNIPEEVMTATVNMRDLYPFLDQLKDPEEYLRKSNQFIKVQPDLSNYLVLEFKDGRIIERFSHPQMQDGKVIGRVLSFRDVTAQKEAERALRESELRNRSLVDKSLGLISAHDMDGVLLSVNPAAARVLGYEPHEFVGRSLRDLLAPSVKHLFDDYLRQIREKGEYSGLMMLVAKSGEERTFAYHNTVLQEDGKPPFVLGHAQDITEMRRAEEEKHVAQKRLQFHLENSGIALIEWSKDWRILGWSPGAEKIFGWKADEVVGKKLPEELNFVYEEDVPAVNETLADLSRGNSMEKAIPNRNYTKDGSVVTCEWFSSVQFDTDGEVASFMTLARDITKRQQMEVELREARDAALESARLKSEFLANMSHEIRTPMNGVIGMTDLLFTTELDAEQREYAETIRGSAGALLTVINDILDFSKIEAGKLHFETIDFDLRNTVESVVELFAEQAQGKKLELASLVEANVPIALRGDPGRLRQVVTNLVGNAIKFTKEGEVIVRVTLERETSEDVWLNFAIKDTGIGISKDVQNSLFQPFMQADGSMTRKYGGTGLGLAISRQLVEMMDGGIKVESEIDKGSTFSFTARFQKQPVIKQKKTKPRADLTDLRVLIVDDNETNRKILKHQVKSWGMIAVKAEDGRDALEKLRSAVREGTPFDLAILDLMMPEMDGFELANEIKNDSLINSVKLILMPSFGTRGHGRTAKQAGIAGYLIKPVRQNDLFDCITTVMGETESGDPDQNDMNELVTRHTLEEKRYQAQSQDLILVAEDNLVNQKVIRGQLERLGYKTEVVGNGLEAVHALQKRAYSLVLMDCQMPEMDGYAATKEIRRREGGNYHTPVIAVTANAMQGEREKCLAAGMDDYISKPIKMNILKDAVERWMEIGSVNITENGKGSADAKQEETALVDMETLNEITDGDADMLNQIVALYVEQTDELLESLSIAVAEKDAAEVYRIAHKTLGSSATCGMQTMVAPLKELEAMGRDGEFNGTEHKLLEVKENYGKLRIYLENLLMQNA